MYWLSTTWLSWYLTYIFNQFYLHYTHEIHLLLFSSTASTQIKYFNYFWITGLLKKKKTLINCLISSISTWIHCRCCSHVALSYSSYRIIRLSYYALVQKFGVACTLSHGRLQRGVSIFKKTQDDALWYGRSNIKTLLVLL